MSEPGKRTVRVQSEYSSGSKQKSKGKKTKVKTTNKGRETVSDVDTGETVNKKYTVKTKNGKTKKDKTVTTIRQGDGKLLAKQVDNKGRSRLRVTRQGKVKGYGKG